ncbi:MAG: pilus assembly protein, partial [Hyphomicrobiales bacterium]|nr:pilus assembly protein [Hyphomicrobiales bacterium]
MNTYLLFLLVTAAIGGVAWVFIYPILSGERNAERRMASVAKAEPMASRRPSRATQKSRREQIE